MKDRIKVTTSAKIQLRVFAVLFIVFLTLFAAISDYKLADYYINDIKYNEYWNPDLGKKNETEYCVVFWNKRWFVDINGAVRRVIGQRSMNNVVKLDNGQLTILKDPIDSAELHSEAESIKALFSYCETQGIPFIYIAAPDMISPYDPQLPAGVQDYSNQNIDIFLDYLKQYQVPYIDMREEFFNSGLNQYDYFSKTDHHWTSNGGYFCYTIIKQWLNDNNIEYDVIASDEKNYSITTYRGKLLGSLGQRTGKYFTGSDDLNVFRPKFDSSITRHADGATGEYDEILLNNSVLETSTPEFIYDELYANQHDYTNNKVDNDTSILLIGDSFSRVVDPFIILSEKEFIFRSCYAPEEITTAFLNETKPDAVILLQSPGNNLGDRLKYKYVEDAGREILLSDTHPISDISDFSKYLSALNDKNYTVFITKDNNKCTVKENDADLLTSLGINTDLLEKDTPYYCVLESCSVLCESADENPGKEYGSLKNGHYFSITSTNKDKESFSSIRIDGIDYSVNKSGLNIVVYDNYNDKVIDSVCFDIRKDYTCNRFD